MNIDQRTNSGGDTAELLLTKRHLIDLANRCEQRSIPMYSRFLNLAEQSLIEEDIQAFSGVDVVMDGGHTFAERRVACFYPRGAQYFEDTVPPFSMITIRPKNGHFAEKLTHRDVLGTLMGLNIDRSCIGDILFLNDEKGSILVFVISDEIASLIRSGVDRMKHTTVVCEPASQELAIAYRPVFKEVKASVASLRIDCMIAAAFSESRSKMSGLFPAKRVFVNARQVMRPDLLIREGDIVSVRGFGRFRFSEVLGRSKKDRQMVLLELYE